VSSSSLSSTFFSSLAIFVREDTHTLVLGALTTGRVLLTLFLVSALVIATSPPGRLENSNGM
jgi:hypothetical protein